MAQISGPQAETPFQKSTRKLNVPQPVGSFSDLSHVRRDPQCEETPNLRVVRQTLVQVRAFFWRHLVVRVVAGAEQRP